MRQRVAEQVQKTSKTHAIFGGAQPKSQPTGPPTEAAAEPGLESPAQPCPLPASERPPPEDETHRRCPPDPPPEDEHIRTARGLQRETVRSCVLVIGSAMALSRSQWNAKCRFWENNSSSSPAASHCAIKQLNQIEWMCEYYERIRQLTRRLMQWLLTPQGQSVTQITGANLTKIKIALSDCQDTILQADSAEFAFLENTVPDSPQQTRSASPQLLLHPAKCWDFLSTITHESTYQENSCQFSATDGEFAYHSEMKEPENAAQDKNSCQRENVHKHEYTCGKSIYHCEQLSHTVICTGGGPGIMEAANRGAMDTPGGRSMGMRISPLEAPLNDYVQPNLAFQFSSLFARKYWMIRLAIAVVAAPGGFGTLDELFELLALKQNGQCSKDMPIVLMGEKYWNSAINFSIMSRLGTLPPDDSSFFLITDSVDTAFEHIVRKITECRANMTA